MVEAILDLIERSNIEILEDLEKVKLIKITHPLLKEFYLLIMDFEFIDDTNYVILSKDNKIIFNTHTYYPFIKYNW